MSYRFGFLLVLLSCACAISSTAQSVVTDIPISGYPSGVAINPGRNRIYVALFTSTSAAVDVIDGSSNTVIDTISTPRGAFVITVNDATGRVYTAGCTTSSCSVTVIDGATDKIVATIPVTSTQGIGMQGITVNPVTNRVYVANADDEVIDVIDGNTNKIVTTISFGGGQPLGLAFDIGTNQLLVTLNGPILYVVSGATNKVVRTISVGQENANTAVNPLTSQAFISNELFQPSTLGVVNLLTGKVVANIAVGNTPFGVAVDLFTNRVLVTNKGDGTIAIVDGYTNTKVASVTAANSTFIEVNPVTRLAYASDNVDSVVHVVSE